MPEKLKSTLHLLTCPFCGGNPNEPHHDGGSDERCGYNFTVTIGCSQCGASVVVESKRDRMGWCIDKGEALKECTRKWNTRQPANVITMENTNA